jgi:hypothetical protein
MTAETAPLQRRRAHLPGHFFVGTIALYALVLGTFLLSRSTLIHAQPNIHRVVPMLAAISFYVAGNLFLLIIGRGHVSRWVVLTAVMTTFIATCVFAVILRARLLADAIDPSREQLRQLVGSIANLVRFVFSGESWLAESLEFAGMIVAEEAAKLLPVFLLIWLGKIRNAHGAMLCGALAGLTFGAVEAVMYGYLDYPSRHEPMTVYLTRFFIMSPLHGMWDALAGGLVFYLSGRWRSNAMRRPGIGAYAAAFAIAVIFHGLHNALQARFGAKMQIILPFALLAPLYVMAKNARRRAAIAGSPEDETILVGDLHLLTISIATLLLGASVTFAWSFALLPGQ